MEKYTCPCCGYKTHNREDSAWDICEVCFWQNDVDTPFEISGANHISLAQAQQNFLKATCKDEYLDVQMQSGKEFFVEETSHCEEFLRLKKGDWVFKNQCKD